MVKVLVLCGGDSPEREISLRSGSAVMQALQVAGHDVTQMDPHPDNGPLIDASFESYDVVFPVLHGIGGEDGTVQAALSDAAIPYVGSDATASRLCFDKLAYKDRLIDSRLPVPNGVLVSSDTIRENPLINRPFVLKPYNGGSSVDTFIVRNPNDADWDAMESAFGRYGEMLLEELIEGTEITVGIIGDRALPVIEIVPPADGEFDYENKYNGATQELCPPESVPKDLQVAAQALALEAHRITNCRDFSRTDMMIDANGELYILETNTIPGMTDQSLLPNSATVAGIDMPALCDQLVRAAISHG